MTLSAAMKHNVDARDADLAHHVRYEPLETQTFQDAPDTPDRELVRASLEFALSKIDANLETFSDHFPSPASVNGIYQAIDNVEWTNGFWTGMLWLAYEVTGKDRYRRVAMRQVQSFQHRLQARINTNHHDLGFLYTLSCVSAFQLTGDVSARDTALGAAEQLMSRYLPAAGIIQAWGDLHDPAQRGRMIIDCALNLPLLYWASEASSDPRFAAAADHHIAQAARYIVRDDASTFHTFYMDPDNGRPLYGKTHQGHSDDSCWARGQAWGIAGFALAYRYTGNTAFLELTSKLANYFLNRLPEDGICCWDLCFTSGSHERDSSAAAITACGLLELLKALPLIDPNAKPYERAACGIIHELSRRYQTAPGGPENGLLRHAVYHMPTRVGVDESCIWGDYFYLEALVRLSRPWRPYW